MGARTILLVEDNANDETLTLRALKKSGINQDVVVVRDGAEALDYIFAHGAYANRESSELPRVILLDLNLPKISGLEVLRALRADSRCRKVPVVILTSSKLDQDLSAGYNLGANSYVVKPVDFVKFSETVSHLSHYWLQINQPC